MQRDTTISPAAPVTISDLSLWLGLAEEKLTKPTSLRLPYKTTTDKEVSQLIVSCTLISLTELNVSMCTISDIALRNMAYFCPVLKKLNASFCEKITVDSINEVIHRCSQFQWLSLAGCTQFHDTNIQSIRWEDSKIRNLDIGYCDQLSASGILYVVERCSNITHLNLSALPLKDEELETLIKKCKNLTHLSLANCEQISSRCIGVLTKEYELKIST